MKIIEKLSVKQADNGAISPATYVCFGDSITQGGFECYVNHKGKIETVIDESSCYGAKLKRVLQILYPKGQINYINAGICGDKAVNALMRLEESVLQYHPDLVIVSFGANDSSKGMDGLEEFKQALDTIFRKIKATGADVIFLTSIKVNTYIDARLTEQELVEVAKRQIALTENGTKKAFWEAGKEIAKNNGVLICDCEKKWQKLSKNGVDTTALLANHINHPSREMHWMYVNEILNILFEN